MFGLSYKGKPVRILPGTSINWTIEDNPFDFSGIGQAFSWPIKIPREGNEHILFFAADFDNPDNLFRTWDGFSITINGNIWWKVSFDLVSGNGQYYEGTLTTIGGKLYESLSTSIRDIVRDHTFTLEEDSADDYYFTKYNVVNSPIVFPVMHFYERGLNIGNGLFNMVNLTNNLLIPSFQLVWVARKCVEALGLKYSDHFTTKGGPLEKIFIVNNRVIPYYSTFDDGNPHDFILGDYLPDITLGDLFNDLLFYAGAATNVTQDQVVESRGISRDLNRKAISVDADPEIQSGRLDYRNIRLEYDLSADQLLDENTVDDLESSDLYNGEFDTVSDFNLHLGLLKVGEFAYIRTKGAYYKKVRKENGGALRARFYTYPFQPYETGEADQIVIQPAMIPTAKDYYSYRRNTQGLTISDNGSGKVRISGFGEEGDSVPAVDEEVYFEEESDEKLYPDLEFTPITARSVTGYIDLDLDFNGEVTVKLVKRKLKNRVGSIFKGEKLRKHKKRKVSESSSAQGLQIRHEENYLFPIIDADLYYPEINDQHKVFQDDETFSGRVLIYHGDTDTNDDVAAYAFASSDEYDFDGNPIGSYSFELERGSKGLLPAVWRSIIDKYRYGRKFIMRVNISPRDVARLFIHKMGKILHGKFRVSRFTAEIGDEGLRNSEIEGIR